MWALDPAVVVGAGRSAFRAADLAQLACLVKSLLEARGTPDSRERKDV